ncbi:MAG: thiosulfohydrolase SoxB, partial [Polaromonas sp.]|nr:thiosulfohydrolase SoxB [Polaromonas sp.]
MNLSRREFASVMAAALATGFPLHREASAAQAGAAYNVPRSGNVHLLHMTDCHAQLMPVYFREPSVNLGVGGMQGKWP